MKKIALLIRLMFTFTFLICGLYFRLVTNEESIRVYYNVNNSKIYQGEEPQYLEINEDQAVGVEFLIKSYPNYVSVEDLPLSNDDEKLTLVADMWNLGILLTEEPIGNMNYD